MAEPGSLRPEQLDAIEDALESLEHEGVPASAADDSDVARRLEDYREVLVLSRAIMVQEEVPAGLLDGVLAQARQSAEAPPLEAPPEAQPRISWWARLRRVALLPGMALAGTAALVLWIVGPDSAERTEPRAPQSEAESAAAPAEGTSRAQGVKSPPPPPVEASNDAPEADPASAADPRPEADVSQEERSDVSHGVERKPRGNSVDRRRTAEPRRDRKKSGASRGAGEMPASGRSKGAKGAGPKAPLEPAPTPSTTPVDADSDVLDLRRADRLRTSGACDEAKPLYRKVSRSADDGAAARALTGLGLCELADGRSSQAESLFEWARSRDATVSKVIESERSTAKAKAKADDSDR